MPATYCVAIARHNELTVGMTSKMQPVIPHIGVETELWLWVERGLTNTEHTVHARLVKAADDTVGVSGQSMKLDVDGTVYTLTTNSSEHVKQPLNLIAVGGQATTYQVSAMFEGANFRTRNLTVSDPHGQDYLVCTTLQWDFKPSQNMVTLTVEAPKTDVTSSASDEEATVTQDDESTAATVPPPKTPEQMQQEANQTGWLTFYNEFSWWYPWYRLHFVLNVPLQPYGKIYVDYGWSPLPFGMSFQTNATVFALILNDIGTEIATDVILGLAVGYVIQRMAAGLAGRTLAGIGWAILVYTAYSLSSAAALFMSSGSNRRAWLVAFLSSTLGCLMDLLLQGLNDIWQWLTAVSRRILSEISHTLNSMWARGLNFFDITGIAFTFIDFALMIGYLTLYKQSAG